MQRRLYSSRCLKRRRSDTQLIGIDSATGRLQHKGEDGSDNFETEVNRLPQFSMACRSAGFESTLLNFMVVWQGDALDHLSANGGFEVCPTSRMSMIRNDLDYTT